MQWMRWFRSRRWEQKLDAELRFHVEQRMEDLVASGMSPEAARREAFLEFGGVDQIKEECRGLRPLAFLDTVLHDIRYALRQLRHNPGFTSTAIVTLALGIGANTAIFSLVNAVRSDALPYKDSDRLVALSSTVMRSRLERRSTSYPDYQDWREQARSFVDIAAFSDQKMTLMNVDEPERIDVEFVSAPYFSLLGAVPIQGRTFLPEEDVVPGAAAVVVMSDGLWRRRFGADRRIIGRTITLNGGPHKTYTVIGVMPPGFQGISDRAELWLPFAQWAPPDIMNSRSQRGFSVLARLKPGVGITTAQVELDGISRQLEQAYPETNTKRGVQVTALDQVLFSNLRSVLMTLLAAVALVLLIACANVANLLVARSEARQREIAVRRALGAGRGRLLRQLVTESLVLTIVGAIAGFLFARLSIGALILQSPITFPSFVSPALDIRVAAFTATISLLCGLVVSFAPLLQANASDVNHALKDSARGSTKHSQRFRYSVIVAEISLAVVLLVGAGLMIRSVGNLAALDPGFDAESVLTLAVSIPNVVVPALEPSPSVSGANPKGATQNASRPVVEGRLLLERIQAVPGVVAAALSTDLPLDGQSTATFHSVEGQPPATDPETRPRAYQHRISPDFFRTLNIPIVRGRTFADSELTATSDVIIVSESLANRFWPGQDVLGKRLGFGSLGSDQVWRRIIGVVGDVKYRRLPENPDNDPDIYLPFADRNSQVAISVRSAVPPESLALSIRAAIRGAEASIAMYGLAPMNDLVQRQTDRSAFVMWLMGVFATMALSLAMVGIYGLLSYIVNQRTREIGIRMALGASRKMILRQVIARGLTLTGIGIVLGLAAAFAVARLIASLLYGVGPEDAETYAAVSIVLIGIGALASYIPARRAAHVDPIQALRAE